MPNRSMKQRRPTLLIPVELQVRELDPKLLVACVAALRGFPSVIGPRREMHFHIPSFPRSIYVSKSMTDASSSVFRVLHRLGHKIVAWDEESLVALPPAAYYKHRLSPVAMGYVSHLFAWGEENAGLWRQYPELPAGIPIHITGNPRGDLLRPELRSFYEEDIRQLRRTYGEFILINSNFNLINAFFPDMNLLMPNPKPGEEPILTRRGKSMGFSREYAEGFTQYKRAILEDFEQLIPALEKAFPDHGIVVRPHPAENQEIYHRLAARCANVRVINKGNVVPWLLAAKALIHNGCTTGVEAFALGVPAIAYQARVNEQFDRDFHRLPNRLSHQCFDFVGLEATLGRILTGRLGVARNGDVKLLIDRHLAARDGALACERIVDVFEEIMEDMSKIPEPTMGARLRSRIWATRRRLKKPLRGYFPNMSHNRPEFLRHRYPEVSLEELHSRLSRFGRLLGRDDALKIGRIARHFFRITVD
jgi:surface carbohydrate biosynthesis protein